MFQDYEYIQTMNADGYFRFGSYRIVDDNFEEIIKGERLGNAIITLYESKQLPVVPNLIKAYMLFCKRRGWKMNDVLILQKENNLEYAKYAEEVERYMLLL